MAKMFFPTAKRYPGGVICLFSFFLLTLGWSAPDGHARDFSGSMSGSTLCEESTDQGAYQNLCGTILDLRETIQALDLKDGLEEALIVKLNNAMTSFIGGNSNAAANQLNAFIQQVEAKRGKQLTQEEANALIAQAASLIAAIENGTASCNGPEVECPPASETICNLYWNNSNLWNQPYWWDNVTGLHDLGEGAVSLTTTSANSCSGSNVDIACLLFLDLNGDGITETIVDSDNPPAPGTVNYDNANGGGTPRVFDGRAVSTDNLYRWAIHESVAGDSRTASLQWKTLAQMPTTANPFGMPGIEPQLPYGTHKIRWIITDICGNQSACEYEFTLIDCKYPNIICKNGLSGNIGSDGFLEVSALTCIHNAMDNYTPASLLQFSIQKSHAGTGFPLDPEGNPVTSLQFDCLELGAQIVTVWAMDLAGNADYCETFIIVQDPNNNCINYRSAPNGEASASAGLELLPNPANTEVQIRLQGLNSAGELTIFNQVGSVVWQQTVERAAAGLKIPLAGSTFMPGVYVVRLGVGQEIITRRLVVIR